MERSPWALKTTFPIHLIEVGGSFPFTLNHCEWMLAVF